MNAPQLYGPDGVPLDGPRTTAAAMADSIARWAAVDRGQSTERLPASALISAQEHAQWGVPQLTTRESATPKRSAERERCATRPNPTPEMVATGPVTRMMTYTYGLPVFWITR